MKKDFFLSLHDDDFWMAMAFLFASRSSKGAACLLVENKKLIYAGAEQVRYGSKSYIAPEVDVMVNCEVPYDHGTIYTTKTPSHMAMSLFLACPKITKVVYAETKDDEEVVEMAGSAFTLVKHESNLNWVRDYMKNLRHLNK